MAEKNPAFAIYSSYQEMAKAVRNSFYYDHSGLVDVSIDDCLLLITKLSKLINSESILNWGTYREKITRNKIDEIINEMNSSAIKNRSRSFFFEEIHETLTDLRILNSSSIPSAKLHPQLSALGTMFSMRRLNESYKEFDKRIGADGLTVLKQIKAIEIIIKASLNDKTFIDLDKEQKLLEAAMEKIEALNKENGYATSSFEELHLNRGEILQAWNEWIAYKDLLTDLNKYKKDTLERLETKTPLIRPLEQKSLHAWIKPRLRDLTSKMTTAEQRYQALLKEIKAPDSEYSKGMKIYNDNWANYENQKKSLRAQLKKVEALRYQHYQKLLKKHLKSTQELLDNDKAMGF